ncbi:endonuclease [Pseudokineococcus marinus]|uniref:Endonuclease n=1 Tax=Pseudokineococcus marinus TaxID=351215 RepID=A0A849BU02_9ACTN|nr:endonuclease [Pseudokineococcus marinus]NNH24302.1 endonuclease [Pseudokineococcus marinus]
MTKPDRRAVLDALLERHGTTYAQESGLRLGDTPAPLFELLVLSSLLSANLQADLGVRTARALREAGLTTAEKLAGASDEERWRVLADAKYLRKEQTARQLGQLAERAQEEHSGDLRRLRDEAFGDGGGGLPALREGVGAFTGIGPLGVDIFCREVQAVWPQLRPFADERATDPARALGLPHDADGLAELAGTDDLSVVGAALVRCGLADDADEVRAAAR